MKKSAQDRKIGKLKKQVEKLKKEKETLQRDKRNLNGRLSTAQSNNAKYRSVFKKKKRNRMLDWTRRLSNEWWIYWTTSTVSGVSRGEQRRLYDERRRVELPKHGINLVSISYNDFGTTKRLKRNHNLDIEVVRTKLSDYIKKKKS